MTWEKQTFKSGTTHLYWVGNSTGCTIKMYLDILRVLKFLNSILNSIFTLCRGEQLMRDN